MYKWLFEDIISFKMYTLKQIKKASLVLKNNNIKCNIGSCPEIYREKIFKKLKIYPKKRLQNAKLLGEISIIFPINPYKKIKKIKEEIKVIGKIFKNLV